MAAAKSKRGKAQKRDAKGRFADEGKTDAERGRLFNVRNAAIAVGLAAAVGGVAYYARKGATGKEKPGEMISRASGGAATTNLGKGVRLTPKQTGTMVGAITNGIYQSRNHGVVALTYGDERTLGVLERHGLMRQQSHPEGTPSDIRKYRHYVPTEAGVQAMVRAGRFTQRDYMTWKNNWKKSGRSF